MAVSASVAVGEREPSDRLGPPWRWGLIAALAAGALMRLIWVQDIEYKGDEAWTFERVVNAGRGEPFPLLGLPTSLEFRNPGMSIWPFVALGRVVAVDTPTDLARAIQVVNVGALLALTYFALRYVGGAQRELWLWAAALAAVNPFTVLFQRKIWPPSIAPLLCVVWLGSWWRREHRGGAFVCGLLGALLAQIHLSGCFFVAGVMGWALVFDRRRVAWSSWLAGSLCGLLALVPWLAYAMREAAAWPARARFWTHLPQPKFWSYWLSEPFGISLHYSLGADFAAFLRAPWWDGRPTYAVGALHVVAVGLAVAIALRAALAVWRQRDEWRGLVIGTRSPTAFTVSAALFGYGIALNAACLHVHRHYTLIAFPLTFVFAAQLALSPARTGALWRRRARVLLVALCLVQALISASFLTYVHYREDAIRGDYGASYAVQQRARTVAARAPAPR
jgi:hypothetical protein